MSIVPAVIGTFIRRSIDSWKIFNTLIPTAFSKANRISLSTRSSPITCAINGVATTEFSQGFWLQARVKD